jgi:hypothetical protein
MLRSTTIAKKDCAKKSAVLRAEIKQLDEYGKVVSGGGWSTMVAQE